MNPETTRVFAYGTLIDPETRAKILGRGCPAFPENLYGYTKYYAEESGEKFPDLIQDANGYVPGVVFEVSRVDLHLLDAWEKLYDRCAVVLTDGEPAWAYFLVRI